MSFHRSVHGRQFLVCQVRVAVCPDLSFRSDCCGIPKSWHSSDAKAFSKANQKLWPRPAHPPLVNIERFMTFFDTRSDVLCLFALPGCLLMVGHVSGWMVCVRSSNSRSCSTKGGRRHVMLPVCLLYTLSCVGVLLSKATSKSGATTFLKDFQVCIVSPTFAQGRLKPTVLSPICSWAAVFGVSSSSCWLIAPKKRFLLKAGD